MSLKIVSIYNKRCKKLGETGRVDEHVPYTLDIIISRW